MRGKVYIERKVNSMKTGLKRCNKKKPGILCMKINHDII